MFTLQYIKSKVNMNSYQKLKAKLKAAKEENEKLRSDIRILVHGEGTEEYYITKHVYGMADDIQKRQDKQLMYGTGEVQRITATVRPDAISFLEGWTRTDEAFDSTKEKIFKKNK